MKILFDTSALSVSKTGISVYLEQLIASLKQLGSGIEVFEEAYKPAFSRNSKFRFFDTILRESYWQTLSLEPKAAKIGADIIHYPAFIFPKKVMIKSVVTVHDAYALRMPDDFNTWHRSITVSNTRRAVEQGMPIITPSEFTRQELISIFPKAQPDQIHTVYSGISTNRYRVEDAQEIEKVKKRYDLKKPFILSVSTIEPRKNFKSLLKAFSRIKDELEHDLILVGNWGWKSADINKIMEDLDLAGRVKFTGFTTDLELNVFYSIADCFVFPSYYEGFGFTPLEAMKCGCPVLSSNASCMPEILKQGADYFDPGNIESMGAAILELLGSDDKKKKLSVNGMQVAGSYSWKQTAIKTLAVYEKVVRN